MSEPSPESPRQRRLLDKATVDRWQVAGGIAGVASVVITLIGIVTDRLPVSVVAGLILTMIGVALLYRWGHEHRRPHTARRFLLPITVTIVGVIVAAVSATLALAPSTSTTVAGRTDNPLPIDSRTSVVPTVPSRTKNSATSAASTAPTTPAGPPAERRAGKVALTDLYAVDLDSMDGDWKIENTIAVERRAPHDLALLGRLDASDIVKATPTAAYFDCANSTGRQTKIRYDEFFKGNAYCLKTDEGRWARVIITARDNERNSTYPARVEMDVVVWEKHTV